jgi:methionyl-tRNA formyltransferase
MKKKLRIAFMGTPEFAVASLKELVESGFDVAVVITAPDRPAGRGRKLTASAVKQYAQKQGIPVLQPTRLKDPEFLKQLEGYDANLQVVVAFRMLPEVVWKMPKYGTFNLHASLLPDYRGAAPINWAVIDGETRTGATTFFIDERIDTGNIILQQQTPIGPEETAGELHDRLMKLGAELVAETVSRIESGEVETRPQKHIDSPKKAPKLNPENTRLSWDSPTSEVFNRIRGLSPYPGAWSLLENGSDLLRVKVYASNPSAIADDGKPGALKQDGKRLFVACRDGWLELLEMQLPGKRRMAVHEILNGLALEKGAHFHEPPAA